MSDWERESRIKADAWRWAARRLEFEAVTEALESDVSQDERDLLEHVRKVVCKTLYRQAERIEQRRRKATK